MAYYTSPEAMFSKRAENFKREGDRHWAMAKNGDGGYHYGKAKECYAQAKANQIRADTARETGATWAKKK